MDTKVCYVTEKDIDKINKAAEVIKRGGLVAFPTETVYGLGANALDEKAVSKIFEAKGRPQDNPLIVHVADFDISKYVTYIPQKAKLLMEAFWPGPITIIMPKSDIIPDRVTAGLKCVGMRMPSNKVARKLIELSKTPIAAPSANLSGKPSPTTIGHCIDDLMGKVDMIIGGDRCIVGVESTVVDTTDGNVTILRPGGITLEMLKEVVGEVKIDPAIMKKPDKDFKPKAPGMKYKHYAPKAPMTVVRGENEKVISYINEMAKKKRLNGEKVGILGTEENLDKYEGNIKICIGKRSVPGIIAANLFDCLREFDKIDVDYIISEGFSEKGIGLAIMNRLKKAAAYNIIDLK